MPEIRASRPGDEDGIRRLFETCHHRPLPADMWAWRYAKRPHGAPVVDVAVDAGEIVGHVGTLPMSLGRAGATMKAGLWVDLMIEPKHRNLTLFLDMAESNRRRCAENGVETLFAFPNNNSFPVLKRMLAWQDCGDILALEAPLASVKRPAPAGKAVRIEAFPNFDALRPKERWSASRNTEQLNWRYRSRPGANYPAWTDGKGYVVVKTFDGPNGKIGDILDFAGEAGVLNAAFDFFAEERVKSVSVWALEGTEQRAALEAAGLKPGGDRTHFAGRRTTEAGPGFPPHHADWTLFKGDSDVF